MSNDKLAATFHGSIPSITGFTTESGSTYRILDGRIRRINDSASKRGDNQSWKLHNRSVIVTGRPVVLILESLANLGPDDIGTPQKNASPVTTRITTPVTKVFYD